LIEESGHAAISCRDEASGLRAFLGYRPDVAILSLDPVESDSWDFVTRVRAVAPMPIIVCANELSVESVQKALDLRVDGFLVKPLSKHQLAERLETLTGRNGAGIPAGKWLYERDGLKIDWRSCEVSVDGHRVELTGTEFRLLKLLVEHQGWVLSHDKILSEVWGPEYQGERDRVKLYVWYLRRKIEANPCKPGLIVTKRGLGYSFVG
jgi:two-component system KDP operon response regulator KdpE